MHKQGTRADAGLPDPFDLMTNREAWTTMRRSDAEMQQKIEALIQDEPDSRERARLLILYQIATVLIDNVSAVRETTKEFREHRLEYDSHIEREERYINQGRGMWRMAGAVVFIAQAMLGYLYYQHTDTMRGVQVVVSSISKDMETIRERHRIEDRTGGQR